MKRTTAKLPDEVDALLRHEAKRRGSTISDVTRQAVEEHLGLQKRRSFLFTACGSSRETDVSERVEEILREELGQSR
jgi:hypothetical protein